MNISESGRDESPCSWLMATAPAVAMGMKESSSVCIM